MRHANLNSARVNNVKPMYIGDRLINHSLFIKFKIMANESKSPVKTILVYCVTRYGQVIGCYSNCEDAIQVVNTSIAKGQLCDMIVKPLL